MECSVSFDLHRLLDGQVPEPLQRVVLFEAIKALNGCGVVVRQNPDEESVPLAQALREGAAEVEHGLLENSRPDSVTQIPDSRCREGRPQPLGSIDQPALDDVVETLRE